MHHCYIIIYVTVPELPSGDMSQYNLWQRLTNANVTPMDRDVIQQALTVFKAPPPAHSPLPLIYHPAKQPLRLSPLPPAGEFHLNCDS